MNAKLVDKNDGCPYYNIIVSPYELEEIAKFIGYSIKGERKSICNIDYDDSVLSRLFVVLNEYADVRKFKQN